MGDSVGLDAAFLLGLEDGLDLRQTVQDVQELLILMLLF